jgi:hypothetical protein
MSEGSGLQPSLNNSWPSAGRPSNKSWDLFPDFILRLSVVARSSAGPSPG